MVNIHVVVDLLLNSICKSMEGEIRARYDTMTSTRHLSFMELF